MPDQLVVDLRLEALKRANRVRFERAAVKSALGARELLLDDVLEPFDVRPCLYSATLLEVISAAKGFGNTKALWALKKVGIPAYRRVGHCPHRQRKQLVRYLMRNHRKAFYGAAWREYLC